MLKRIRNALIGLFGGLLIRTIGMTLRFEIKDESGILKRKEGDEPVIFAFWHNRMLMMPYIYQRFMPDRSAVCLASASQDGEMIARVLAHFGLDTIRGSSSRRGRKAYRELNERIKEGFDAAITPDGPRGPCYHAQWGAVALSANMKCSIIPMSYRVGTCIRLSSWDRLIIPLPFTSCELTFGHAIYLPEESSDLELEKGRVLLESRLREMTGEDLVVSGNASTTEKPS